MPSSNTAGRSDGLLAANSFGWAKQLPGVEYHVLQALLVATTVLQLAGPILTTFALGSVARESHANH